MNKDFHKTSTGGAAASAGFEFQHKVSAWFSVHILAEKASPSLFGLPSDVSITRIHCEPDQPIDDILVETSANGALYIQCKTRLYLSIRENSEFAKAISQFVKQYLSGEEHKTIGKFTWQRPIDQYRDRLVLAVSSGAPLSIKKRLKNLLDQIRALREDQPLADAAKNRDAKEILEKVISLIKREWLKIANNPIEEFNLRTLLSSIYICEFAFDSEGRDKELVRHMLRQSILSEDHVEQDDVAWNCIIIYCSEMAANRQSADRASFRNLLLSNGIKTKFAISFVSDIKKIQEYSNKMLDSIPLGLEYKSEIIPIPRPNIIAAIQEEVEIGPCFIIGEPGAGKSWSLRQFARECKAKGFPIIFLRIDFIRANSDRSLREEIALEHDLLYILNEWKEELNGILIIDSLDVARREQTIYFWRELIRRIYQKTSWRIIASIRTYDLRHSQQLINLFPGYFLDRPHRSAEFKNRTHVFINLLSETEISEVSNKIHDLKLLLERANESLKDLLRNPFNLQIVCYLLSDGINVDELTSLSSEFRLLTYYWKDRITDKPNGRDREIVLKAILIKMEDLKKIVISKIEIDQDTSSNAFDNVLSDNIIKEWAPPGAISPDRILLTFSHNALLDYAASCLLIPRLPQGAIDYLINKDRFLFLRTSIKYYIAYLWHMDRQAFWELLWKLMESANAPIHGKIMPFQILVEESGNINDFKPFLSKLSSYEESYSFSNIKATQFILDAISTLNPPICMVLYGHLLEFLHELKDIVPIDLIGIYIYLIGDLIENSKNLSSENLYQINECARIILHRYWHEQLKIQNVTAKAITIIARSFKAAPEESKSSIRNELEKLKLENVPIELISDAMWLSYEIENIITSDPDFALEIYLRLFEHQETSEEKTPMGGRIISLISTRRQDYEHAQWTLSEKFPVFLNNAPIQAVQAVIKVMEIYVELEHTHEEDNIETERFRIGKILAKYKPDYSYIWDETYIHKHHPPIKMLNSFCEFMTDLAKNNSKKAQILAKKIIVHLASHNELAVIWKRLLKVGAENPKFFVKLLRPLLESNAILVNGDTRYKAGKFLKAALPYFSQNELARIEDAILNLMDIEEAKEKPNLFKRIRNEFLGIIGLSKISRDESRKILEMEAIPESKPSAIVEEFTPKPFTEEEFLAEQGVDINAHANRSIREIARPIKEFNSKHSNSIPDIEECESILPDLQKLAKAVERADIDGVDPKQEETCSTSLAETCTIIARQRSTSLESKTLYIIKDYLLNSYLHRSPEPSQELYGESFDSQPHYGPAPRIIAANGLIELAVRKEICDKRLFNAIERLSRDAVAPVRHHIALRLRYLYNTNNELMWRLINQIVQEDNSSGVLMGLCCNTLQYLANSHQEDVLKLIRLILSRYKKLNPSKHLVQCCYNIITSLYLWQNNKTAYDMLSPALDEPVLHEEGLIAAISLASDSLMHGPLEPLDEKADAIRNRTLILYKDIIKNCIRDIERLENNYGLNVNNLPDEAIQRAKGIYNILDNISTRLYFAAKRDESTPEKEDAIFKLRKRLLEEAFEIFDKLATIGHPHIAYRLIETLGFLIPCDPEKVLKLVHKVVISGKQGGFQYETLALKKIVSIIARYLADYRNLLREIEELRDNFVQILDTFVDVGRPEARNLTYRLEEIFR